MLQNCEVIGDLELPTKFLFKVSVALEFCVSPSRLWAKHKLCHIKLMPTQHLVNPESKLLQAMEEYTWNLHGSYTAPSFELYLWVRSCLYLCMRTSTSAKYFQNLSKNFRDVSNLYSGAKPSHYLMSARVCLLFPHLFSTSQKLKPRTNGEGMRKQTERADTTLTQTCSSQPATKTSRWGLLYPELFPLRAVSF